jgi:hypothetical protein
VQEFFKIILEEVVEQIEITCSSKKMTFKLNEIEEQILEKYREKKNKSSKMKKNKDKDKEKDKEKERNSPNINMSNYDSHNTLNMSMSFLSLESEEVPFNYKNVNQSEKEEEFNKIYSIPMDRALLEKLINQYKDKDKKVYEYLILQLNKMEDVNIYSNNNFKRKAYETRNLSYEIIQSYQLDFIRIITFIEEILDKLIKNFHFLPYSVKCLCKIISILIRKKFPKITTVEENAFISQFFFYNLFVPIFNNPSTGALINNFIISGNTTHNLNIISYIFLQFVSGNFFKNNLKNGDFTFFNRFFVNEMPKLFILLEQLTKVELPSFIEKFVNDELPKDYKYDYFKENPDQLMFHRAICYNLYDLTSLLDNIETNRKKIFYDDSTKLFEKTFEKLNSKTNRNLIVTLKKNQKKEILKKSIKKKSELKEIEVEGKKQIYHFLETELLCNEKYSKLFSIKQRTPYFSLKELKKTSNEEEVRQNNIIKVKNFFSALLCNYMDLAKKDFNENSISNVKDILKELKLFLKSSNYVVDGKIPMEWYATSLIQYLDKIPREFRVNNYELLFNDIENDLNK